MEGPRFGFKGIIVRITDLMFRIKDLIYAQNRNVDFTDFTKKKFSPVTKRTANFSGF